MPEAKSISVQELAKISEQGSVEVIDVRTPAEFVEVHSTLARNIPLDTLDPPTLMESIGSADKQVFVICKSGARGAKAQQKFHAAGFDQVVNVQGGTDAWVAANLPVLRGQKVMSLERQVRIAAGTIVFLGALAAILTNNVYLAAIPAFVGAGLVFAGITDTCGMGMLIAKMPWNQVAKT